MQYASDAIVRDIINTQILYRGSYKYDSGAENRVMTEYQSKKHAFKQRSAVIDFLENALRECEKANG